MGLPSKYPDLVTTDFYLFTQMKQARGFCDDTDIIRNATEELKRLLQNGFQECLRYLYRRCQKWGVAQGNYSDGNLA
jgi:hypothetical protein